MSKTKYQILWLWSSLEFRFCLKYYISMYVCTFQCANVSLHAVPIFKLKKEGMAQDFCTVLYNIPLYFDNPWLIKNKKKAVVYCRNNNRRQIILQKVCVVFGVARLFCDLQTLWGPGPPLATSYLCSWSLAQSATDFRSQQTRANYKKKQIFVLY